MPRNIALLLTLATLSASPALAQSADSAVPSNSSTFVASSDGSANAPAPIVRAYANAPARYNYAPDSVRPAQPQSNLSRPVAGVSVRSSKGAEVQTVSATKDTTELRLQRGIANVSVYHPEGNMQILVDLPGGQAALLKDGLYTFNAETNTVRVFRGEAEAFTGANDKGVKVHEDHELVFGSGAMRAVDLNRTTARADLLPGTYPGDGEVRYRSGYINEGYYGGGYPYGFGYPYGYGWGGPFGYGYPYAFGGYPYGFGLGIGFGYGGFYGRGFRGGYGGFRGGFHR